MPPNEELPVKIQLTQDQLTTLIFELGYAAGAHAKQEGSIPTAVKRLTNAIMSQTGGYSYYGAGE